MATSVRAMTYATEGRTQNAPYALFRATADVINPDCVANAAIAELRECKARTYRHQSLTQVASVYHKARRHLVIESIVAAPTDLRPGDLEGIEDIRAGRIRTAASFEEFAHRLLHVAEPWDDE